MSSENYLEYIGDTDMNLELVLMDDSDVPDDFIGAGNEGMFAFQKVM